MKQSAMQGNRTLIIQRSSSHACLSFFQWKLFKIPLTQVHSSVCNFATSTVECMLSKETCRLLQVVAENDLGSASSTCHVEIVRSGRSEVKSPIPMERPEDQYVYVQQVQQVEESRNITDLSINQTQVPVFFRSGRQQIRLSLFAPKHRDC